MMFKHLNKLVSGVLISGLLSAGASTAFAAPPHQGEACAQDYIVQADDWLSRIADKFFGDSLAYPAIVEATAAARQADSGYANITNPDVIEIGWQLCLPEGAAMMADGSMVADDGQMSDDAMMDNDAMDGTMADGAMMEGKSAFTVRIDNIGQFAHKASGFFNTPIDAAEPGPLPPGGTYEFSFNAAPGDNLNFATMLVQSNDLFIGPDETGIALFNEDGSPISGDVTDQVLLWDAGTEIDQEPGVGPDQAPNQSGPNVGEADPDNTVRLADNAFGNLPAVNEVAQVTIESPAANQFIVRIQNITDGPILATSTGDTVPVPFAPGVWVIHTEPAPLFTTGQADRGLGLEALAEDGNPAPLAEALAANSGIASPLAPGVWVVHTSPNPLFAQDQADRGQGLEALAEDGNPAALAEALASQEDVVSSGVFNTPVDASEPGPALPGSGYAFTIEAAPGDYLNFATMFVQSNDLFFGPDGQGIPLFGADGTPLSGDVTDQAPLWDAGTEINEAPGLGTNQAPRQSGPNVGPAENGTVRLVDDGYSYPAPTSSIRVTVTPR